MAKTQAKGLSLPFAVAFSCFVFALGPLSDETRAKADRARQLLANGQAEEAIPLYLELAGAAPRDPQARANLAIAQYKAGRFRDAAASAEAALGLAPQLFPALLFLGASRLELGEAAAAVGPLRAAVAAQPQDRNARGMLAEALLQTGQAGAAAREYEQVVAAAPENARAWNGLGRAYETVAGAGFRRVSEDAPGSGYDLALAAEFEAGRGQLGRAFSLYRRALALQPGLPGLHEAVAGIYEKTGHADWAARERAAAAKAPPPDCGRAAAACEFLAGRYAALADAPPGGVETEYWRARGCRELARRAYARLASLPASAEQQEAEARQQEARGQYKEAAERWKRALELAPSNARIRQGLAVALWRANDPAALPLLQGLLARAPDSAELNFLCGAALLSSQQAEAALPYLERAVKLDGASRPARAALGQAYLQTGRAREAIPQLEAALADDADGGRHYQLARAYRAAGEPRRAAEAAKAADELRRRNEREQRAPEITPP